MHEYGIPNYNGFIPLNYLIPEENFLEFCGKAQVKSLTAYLSYIRSIKFETNPITLRNLGAEHTEEIKHPHILDLLNENHREHIH